MTVWLTCEEAAKRLGRHTATIKRWTKLDVITPVLGRYREDELLEVDRMMRERQVSGIPQPEIGSDVSGLADAAAADLARALHAAGHGRWRVTVRREDDRLQLVATPIRT